jgi:biopolymer transport protein ExbD
MQAQSEDKPYDDINITPMLDLAYVLLVIFILMCTASVQGVKVNLPKASAAPSLAKPKTRAKAKQAGDFPVVIKGDSETQYQGVMDVLDVLGRLGLSQVGLATKKKG